MSANLRIMIGCVHTLEQGSDSDNDFNRIPEGRIQQSGKSLTKGERHLFSCFTEKLKLWGQVIGAWRGQADAPWPTG